MKIKILLEKILKRFEEHYIYENNKIRNTRPVLDTLIATKLSQNTTDKTSYIAYRNLKNKFKSWNAVADAPLNKIINSIRVCGLANTKAKDIKTMLIKMREKYGDLNLNKINKLKDDEIYRELLQYKGIGVKTVSCVLAFSLGRDVFPVDTHIHRVLNRLGVVKTKTPEQTYLKSKDLIPEGKKFFLHTGLIKFGRNVCRSNKPLCNSCFLNDLCIYDKKNNSCTGKQSKIKQNNFIILENI